MKAAGLLKHRYPQGRQREKSAFKRYFYLGERSSRDITVVVCRDKATNRAVSVERISFASEKCSALFLV